MSIKKSFYDQSEYIIIFIFIVLMASFFTYEERTKITFKSPTELILETAETRLAKGMNEEDVKLLLKDEMQVLEDSIDKNKGRFTITPIMRNRIGAWYAGYKRNKEPKNAKAILIIYKDGVVGRVIYDADKNSLETQEDVVKYFYEEHIKSSEIERVSIGNSNNIFYDCFLLLITFLSNVIVMVALFYLPYYMIKDSLDKRKEEKTLLVNKVDELETKLNEKEFIETNELDIKNY